jgi:hypothetical protein
MAQPNVNSITPMIEKSRKDQSTSLVIVMAIAGTKSSKTRRSGRFSGFMLATLWVDPVQ